MRRNALALVLFLLLCACSLNTAEAAEDDTLTLSLLGDCSIGDSFKIRTYDESYATAIEKNGFEWPFSLVRSVLEADDVTVANLEVVFTTKRKQADKKTNLIAAPQNAQALLHSGIEVLNTANNHSYDFNDVGYWESMETLDGLGIAHFGSPNPGGMEIEDRLLVYEEKGIKIGFIGFSYPDARDVGLIAERIKLLRAQGCGLVIVSLHWGRELQPMPENKQYDYAKKILDAGADVLYGHHPHVLQPVHFYGGKPVFYSLGNFTFGAPRDLRVLGNYAKALARCGRPAEALEMCALARALSPDHRARLFFESVEEECRATMPKLGSNPASDDVS